MVRRGEVRANGGRIRPDYRLRPGDNIRIPPVFDKPGKTLAKPPAYLTEMIKDCIMYEDERFVVVNKPAGLVVHSGTGRSFGVIELLRELYLQKKGIAFNSSAGQGDFRLLVDSKKQGEPASSQCRPEKTAACRKNIRL